MKQYLAIDIGGTSVKLGLVDETGGILAKAEESVSFDGWQTPILTTVLAAAERFLTARGEDPQALEALISNICYYNTKHYFPFSVTE